MKNIAIFASGSGTNAERITRYFQNHPQVRIDLILSNRADAYVLERAKNLGVDSYVFTREEMKNPDGLSKMLLERNTDLIVLAGFLWLIPPALLKAFPNKIINIHPALLPKFGGKNMYGMRVHEAVIEAGEKESGITIHFVDEVYDHGRIIHQAKCVVEPKDTPELLAGKIHTLEYEHYPVVIEKLLSER
jgi:phosphoribosylglycinamide formyltransferase-1